MLSASVSVALNPSHAESFLRHESDGSERAAMNADSEFEMLPSAEELYEERLRDNAIMREQGEVCWQPLPPRYALTPMQGSIDSIEGAPEIRLIREEQRTNRVRNQKAALAEWYKQADDAEEAIAELPMGTPVYHGIVRFPEAKAEPAQARAHSTESP